MISTKLITSSRLAKSKPDRAKPMVTSSELNSHKMEKNSFAEWNPLLVSLFANCKETSGIADSPESLGSAIRDLVPKIVPRARLGASGMRRNSTLAIQYFTDKIDLFTNKTLARPKIRATK